MAFTKRTSRGRAHTIVRVLVLVVVGFVVVSASCHYMTGVQMGFADPETRQSVFQMQRQIETVCLGDTVEIKYSASDEAQQLQKIRRQLRELVIESLTSRQMTVVDRNCEAQFDITLTGEPHRGDFGTGHCWYPLWEVEGWFRMPETRPAWANNRMTRLGAVEQCRDRVDMDWAQVTPEGVPAWKWIVELTLNDLLFPVEGDSPQ